MLTLSAYMRAIGLNLSYLHTIRGNGFHNSVKARAGLGLDPGSNRRGLHKRFPQTGIDLWGHRYNSAHTQP